MSNIFSCIGTLVRDSEVRQLPSGASVLNFTMANNTGFGDREKTLWIRVAVFGKRAEGGLSGYLVKGQKVFVSGELSQNEYQANDGTTKTSLELNANVVDLVGSMYQSGNNGSNAKPPVQAQMQTQAQAKAQAQAQAQAYGHNQNQNKALDDYQDVPY